MLTAQVLPYLSCPPTASYSQRGHGMFPYKGRGNSWQRVVRSAQSRSPRFGASLCVKQGCFCKCCCCWHAWAFLAASADTARTERVWKVSVPAEGGPVCLERDCLPNKRCQLYVGCALKEEASTHPGCLCVGRVPSSTVQRENKSNCACCLLLLLFAFWSGLFNQRCLVQGSMVSFSVEEMLYALVSPEEGEQRMRGSSEEGEAAASHKCLVFFVVKALPLSRSDSHYCSVIFLSQSFLLPLKANSQGLQFLLLPGSFSICSFFVCL